jgi:flagellar basal-body rod protein FlgF/flagellar basal-body rod protein FlgG
MYISAEGAQIQQQRLQVIANNLANMETAGFKRDVPMFQARFAEAIQ